MKRQAITPSDDNGEVNHRHGQLQSVIIRLKWGLRFLRNEPQSPPLLLWSQFVECERIMRQNSLKVNGPHFIYTCNAKSLMQAVDMIQAFSSLLLKLVNLLKQNFFSYNLFLETFSPLFQKIYDNAKSLTKQNNVLMIMVENYTLYLYVLCIYKYRHGFKQTGQWKMILNKIKVNHFRAREMRNQSVSVYQFSRA